MKINLDRQPTDKKIIVNTSSNNKDLAQKIRQVSAELMRKNYQLYKDLENK